VKMDAVGSGAGNENLRLPADELVARAKRVDAPSRKQCPCAQGNRE
jgi:hypothetical protein